MTPTPCPSPVPLTLQRGNTSLHPFVHLFLHRLGNQLHRMWWSAEVPFHRLPLVGRNVLPREGMKCGRMLGVQEH